MPSVQLPRLRYYPDTPLLTRLYSIHSMDSESLKDARARHRDTAAQGGRTRVAGMNAFYQTYLPDWKRLSRSEWEKLYAALLRDKVINKEGVWADLPPYKKTRTKTGSKARRTHEDTHFRRLEKVVERVLEVAERTLKKRFSRAKRTTKFMCRPLHTTDSEVPGSSQRVDAMFVRLHSSYPSGAIQGGSARNAWADYNGERIMTADLTNTGELKLHDTDRDVIDNEDKTLGFAGHAFWNDVGRAAVLSFTIEDSNMRLWYHSRSHTVVSALFDIYDEPQWLVEFILFNTYAPLSMLGIDPTVRRVLDDKAKLQYQFDIYAEDGSYKTYQTVNVLEDVASKQLYTRSMRVYTVHLVLQNADSHADRVFDPAFNVLRDYWVYSDVQDEGVIQKNIMRELEPLPDWPDIERHFMGIEEDGAVRYPPADPSTSSSVPPPPAGSKFYHWKRKNNPKEAAPAAPKVKSASAIRTSGSRNGVSKLAPQADSDPILRVHGKKHCRTVYKQLCLDLGSVSSPALYFYGLSQVVKILKYLKRAGYVHRDVSPGNFLLYHASGTLPKEINAELDKWITLVSDLEYARPYRGGTGHDPLTGTPGFVAVEVQQQKHEFKPQHTDAFTVPAIAQFFSFNYYHDLEAALWLALDFAFRRIPKSKLDVSTPWGPADAVLRQHAADLFPGKLLGSKPRSDCIIDGAETATHGQALMAIHGAEAPILKIFDLIRQLRNAYSRIEDSAHVPVIQLDHGRKVLDDSLFTEDIYDLMEATFRDVSNAYLHDDEEFIRVPPPPAGVISPPRMASEPRDIGPRPLAFNLQEAITEEGSESEDWPEPPSPRAGTKRSAGEDESTDASSHSRRGTQKRITRGAAADSKPPRKRVRPSSEPTRRSSRLAAKAKKAEDMEAQAASKTRSTSRRRPKTTGVRR